MAGTNRVGALGPVRERGPPAVLEMDGAQRRDKTLTTTTLRGG